MLKEVGLLMSYLAVTLDHITISTHFEAVRWVHYQKPSCSKVLLGMMEA
jgi:hypothetical protein